jgi:hypothetical protein
MSRASRYTGLIDRYAERLPIAAEARRISLGEGNTPLIKLDNLVADLPAEVEIYVKYEGLNPTGSFKDRGMTTAVTQAVAEGAEAIICASTGNTSASAAAYAARAGITAFVLIPDGKIAMGKLAQAIMHGAEVLQRRSAWLIQSTPTDYRARKPRRSKSVKRWAARPTITVCPLAMPATSPPIGWVIAKWRSPPVPRGQRRVGFAKAIANIIKPLSALGR